MRGSNLKFPSHYGKAPTRYAADGKKDVKARFVENAYRGLDSKMQLSTPLSASVLAPRTRRLPPWEP